MRIERIYDMSEILRCLPFEREIRTKGRDTTKESHAMLFIQSQLNNPLFGFWIAYNHKDQIIGYVCAIIGLLPGSERLHLLRIYAKEKELFNKFEEVLIEWAKQYKVKIAQITTKKYIRAIQRKYKFIPVSVNMERRF